MDRTIIGPYRAEEKELSLTLYKALQGLMLLYPPSEDLRKCVSDEMFLKSNQNAFFHVMHYLFRIFDAQEFKKRFFWPITDKRSESSFRNATVEYLKHINEKYHLNWPNIKSYLVVMPGGMKFISFLIDFIYFITQELVKQKEKQINVDAKKCRPQVSEANLRKMVEKNEVFKAMASDFIEALDNLNSKYDKKSEMLMQHIEKLSEDTGLNIDLLLDEKYLESFENSNYQLFEKCYSDRSKKVTEMEQLINELKEAIGKFYSKETGYNYDKERIRQQLKLIRDNFPLEELKEESFGHKVADDGVSINALISTFNAINETIQNELRNLNEKPGPDEFVYSRCLSLKSELQEIEAQITNLKKNLNDKMKKSKTDLTETPAKESKKRSLENALQMKLVSTPPIKFEIPEGGGKSRLALVDSKATNTNDTTFTNFLAPPRAMSIRQTNRNSSLVDQTISSDLNTTVNRSRLIDPIELLRSSTKKDSSKSKQYAAQLNLSNLAAKWKQNQSFLNVRDDNITITAAATATPPTKISQTHPNSLDWNKTSPQSLISSNMVPDTSPFTPFSSNNRTRIARTQLQLDPSAMGGFNSFGSTASTNAGGKLLFAVKKVQDASLNFANLSTSPSGRLEPLVKADDIDIPKIKVNEVTLNEENESVTNVMFEKLVESTGFQLENCEELNDGNNQNLENIGSENLSARKSHQQDEMEEEALFNITDGVLKDVTL